MRSSSLGALASVMVLDFLPRVLPAGWRQFDAADDGARYVCSDGRFVIISAATEADGKRWLHVSCSRASRLPSWEDLADVKAIFVGAERYAYQVLPPRSRHVNINPHVLHLWSCLDADKGAALPEFSGMIGGTRSL